MMIRILCTAFLCLFLFSQPAQAAPVIGALVAAGKAFVASITLKSVVAAALKQLIVTGVSVLMEKYQKSKRRDPGLVTTHTTKGGTDPQATVVGRYATGGHVVYQNSYGSNHNHNVHVVEVGDLPGARLRALIIDGERSEIGTEWREGYGYPILTKVSGQQVGAYVRFYDGSQTQADPELVRLFADHPERPWTPDHLLTGISYAVLTFFYHSHLFPNGHPEYLFELDGPGFYDPRKDSSVGGNGDQRWDAPQTWEHTDHPMVISYNILRGIRLPCGRIYGGDFDAEDLPLPQWFEAMDATPFLGLTDIPQPLRCGYEIKFEEAPADILKDLFTAANAQIVEVGGFWYPIVGDSGAAVAEISLEEDLSVSEAWTHDPFPDLNSTFNAITASHPSPDALWNPTTTETISRASWITEDGREKLHDLALPMVWDDNQARQIADTLLNENRRFRTHKWPLLPEFFRLRPLQTINATSEDYQYTSKSFRITEVVYDLLTLNVSISVRECDPTDFAPNPALALPSVPAVTSGGVPTHSGVTGFAVFGGINKDGDGNDRAPTIRILWDADIAPSTEALTFRVKVAGTSEIRTASTQDVASGEFHFEPVIRATDYLVQAKPVARNRATSWSAWLPVTAPDVGLAPADLSSETFETLADASFEIASGLDNAVVEAQDIASLATLGQLLQAYNDREADRVGVAQADEDIRAYVDDQDAAHAEQTAALGAVVAGHAALIEAERKVRSSETGALAQDLVHLNAQLGAAGNDIAGHAAAISQLTTEVELVDGAISAQAQAIDLVEAEVGGISSSVSETMTAVAGIHAEYTLQIDVDGVVSGMVLRSEKDDDGAVISETAFKSDRFAIVGPDGTYRTAPFVVYTTPRVIDGKLFPAGVYMENVFLGKASIGRAQIEDTIQSDNYAEDADGIPTAGLKLDFKNGIAKAAGVFFSRPMILAQGAFTLPGTIQNGANWSFVNTGIQVGKSDVWRANSVALVAVASVTSGGTAPSGFDPNNAFWTLNASIQPGARWNGFGGANPDPTAIWQKDPGQLITPYWASGSDQRVFLKIHFEATNGVHFVNPTIEWTVFQVT